MVWTVGRMPAAKGFVAANRRKGSPTRSGTSLDTHPHGDAVLALAMRRADLASPRPVISAGQPCNNALKAML